MTRVKRRSPASGGHTPLMLRGGLFLAAVIVVYVFTLSPADEEPQQHQYPGVTTLLSIPHPHQTIPGAAGALPALVRKIKPQKKQHKKKPVTYTLFDVSPSKCGMPWTEYIAELKPRPSPDAAAADADEIFLWTVSGGEEYRNAANMLLTKWKSLDIHPVLLLALDIETAESVCASGYHSVYWDPPQASYSRVADAKFQGAAQLAERHHFGFFIEMDVFCRENPIQLFVDKIRDPKVDLAVIGHGDVAHQPNIGVWLAKPTMVQFFRGIIKVLSYSKDNKQYSNWNGKLKAFFDQEIMNNCKERSTDNQVMLAKMRVKYYLPEDAEAQTLDLMNHCNLTRVNFALIDHSIIQSHDPPTVYDTTICLHPLFPVPFVPFGYKLATAKFLGFDAEIRSPQERLLKMDHGDYTCNECWQTTWFSDNLDIPRFQDMIKYQITAMAVFANETQRTLVLPRYMRDKDAFGVPLTSVVDVGTLNVKWRMMSIDEAREIDEDDVETIALTKNAKETELLSQIGNSDARVVALSNICHLNPLSHNGMISEALKKIRFCISTSLKFGKGFGGWSKMCFPDKCKTDPGACK